MTRSILSGLLGFLSVAIVGSLPLACQSGGVGDPCTPEDEYDPGFAGFKVTEENIESRSFQCQTRICLVNHFQGRASCPAGQTAPTYCDPSAAAPCAEGSGSCVESSTFAPECADNSECASGKCNVARGVCECNTVIDCPGNADPAAWSCSKAADEPDGPQLCRSHVCFKDPSDPQYKDDPTAGCQDPAASAEANAGKACCVPGTNKPIAASVCGQCQNRNSENAVYCSCRCGPAEGSNNPEDENFNFCTCPDGFTCAEIRPNLGLGDPQITGKYCIKRDTEYTASALDIQKTCGNVSGYFESQQCKGNPAPATP